MDMNTYKQIEVSGEPSISEIIHHSQSGSQYINLSDKTIWRVTRVSGDVVQLHTVNGWEQLYQTTCPVSEFWNRWELYSGRHTVKVVFDNGDHLVTGINGTKAEVKKYYLGQMFNIGTGGHDLMVTAVSVEFL